MLVETTILVRSSCTHGPTTLLLVSMTTLAFLGGPALVLKYKSFVPGVN